MRDAVGPSVAVGFFDGVHLGHQALLKGADVALTFREHPRAVLDPARAPRLIMTLDERLAAIRACGVREVVALAFTSELAQLSPQEFFARHLARSRVVRCGANWRFGHGGAGDAAYLRAQGISVEIVAFASYGGQPISSSRIRQAIEGGDLVAAQAMLGRPFALHGAVVQGKGVGATLGFPTVNVEVADLMLQLPLGVYAVECAGQRGLANWGVAPTMGDAAWSHPMLEVHLLAPTFLPTQDSSVRVELLHYIRPERSFPTRAALQRQIAADCEVCKKFDV